MTSRSTLKKGLSRRHVMFIALGSAIGTGLFYGAGSAIRLAGPSVLLAYCIAGLAAFMVMRALGEMALRNPLSGSFGRYATSYIAPAAGFMTGWTYVFEMALVCLADVTAFSAYMGFWYPAVSPWVWALAITLILIGINLFTVKAYGELEFWLSFIKVAAIIGLIVVGTVIIVFGLGSDVSTPIGFQNLWERGGWFPHGWFGFVAAFSVVVFAFGGIEIIGLTVTETRDAEHNIPRTINAIPIRILLFYVLALAVLMSIYPWDELVKIPDGTSPFVLIFAKQGFHYAATVFNVVVCAAAISAINSDLYGAGRMMHGLAQEGHALKWLTHVSRNGVPVLAVLVMLPVLLVGVVLNRYYHDQLFFLVAAMATFATVFVWLMILLSQVGMRLRLSRADRLKLKYRVPFWPVGPLLAIIFMLLVIGLLGFVENTRPALGVGVIWIAWLALCYLAIKHLDKKGRWFLKKPQE